MKYKKLTEYQILISLDRLTRFKNPREKYFRVFSDILLENLIEPKLKKSDIEKMNYNEISNIVSNIFQETLNYKTNDFTINHKLIEYENSIYNNDKETQKLLDNKIPYANFLEYVKDDAPINLKWLKSLKNNNCDLKKIREQKFLKFPIEKVILAEGITEEILLPAFAKKLNYDFYQKGVQIIAAGGKNQVVKMYYKLAEELKIPIFILLDKDAEENSKQITPRLRPIDNIHTISCGEFEDLLPKSLIVRTINSDFKNFLTINEEDLISDDSTAKVLEDLFRVKGLHEFKKAEFAKQVRDNIKYSTDISDEVKNIIKKLSTI